MKKLHSFVANNYNSITKDGSRPYGSNVLYSALLFQEFNGLQSGLQAFLQQILK